MGCQVCDVVVGVQVKLFLLRVRFGGIDNLPVVLQAKIIITSASPVLVVCKSKDASIPNQRFVCALNASDMQSSYNKC